MNVVFKTNNLKDLAILINLAKRLNIEVEKIEDSQNELQVDQLTQMSLESFKDIWKESEDDTWEEFYKETLD